MIKYDEVPGETAGFVDPDDLRCQRIQVLEQRRRADDAELARLLAEHGPDAVINFAAESHVDRSIADGSTFVRTNCMGTNVLCDVANTVGVDKDAGRGSPGGRS